MTPDRKGKNKMYLLLKGEVGLVSGGKSIGRVRPGEIFGEMALISDAPRSASAVARTACKVIALRRDVTVTQSPPTPPIREYEDQPESS